MAPQSILDVLPLDVVELVLKAIPRETGRKADCRAYRELRLLRKDFNNLVEPSVFGKVSIKFTLNNKEYVGDKLAAIASGNSPFTRWAKVLTVEDLLPIKEHLQYGYSVDTFRGADREKLLGFQTKWLSPAIIALTNVEEARFTFKDRTPCDEVLEAFACLPSLRKVSFNFIDLTTPALGKISNLEHIIVSHPSDCDSESWKNLGRIVANSPDLSQLHVVAELSRTSNFDPSQPGDLHDVLAEAMQSQTFQPKLRRLSIPGNAPRLTASCIPFLRQLSHLTVGPAVEPEFWKALASEGVPLQTLHLSRLDHANGGYMLSSSGLKEISVGWPYLYDAELPGDGDEVFDRFFQEAIPRHRHTLKVLRLLGGLGPWCASKTNMQGILQCASLRTLYITCFFPPKNKETSIYATPLDWIFSSIARRITGFRELGLFPVRKYRQFGQSKEEQRAHFRYRDDVKKFFAYTVGNTEFAAEIPPRFSISCPAGEFKVAKASSTGNLYRCEAVEGCAWAGDGGRDQEVYDPDA